MYVYMYVYICIIPGTIIIYNKSKNQKNGKELLLNQIALLQAPHR